jgi:hypothetical protein
MPYNFGRYIRGEVHLCIVVFHRQIFAKHVSGIFFNLKKQLLKDMWNIFCLRLSAKLRASGIGMTNNLRARY